MGSTINDPVVVFEPLPVLEKRYILVVGTFFLSTGGEKNCSTICSTYFVPVANKTGFAKSSILYRLFNVSFKFCGQRTEGCFKTGFVFISTSTHKNSCFVIFFSYQQPDTPMRHKKGHIKTKKH